MASVGPAPAPAVSDSKAATPDAVSRIQAILAAESAPPPQAKPKAAQAPEPEPEQEQQEQQPAPAEGEPQAESQGEPEAEPEQNQQIEGQEADAPTAREIPLEELEGIELEVTIKGDDGKDVVRKPTIKELREGYMMQSDYQRKTADLARQREETAESTRKAVETERTQYQQNLQTLHNLVLETAASELKDVNWNDLAKNDPLKYVEIRNRADQLANTLTTIQGKMKETEAKQATDRKTATDAAAKRARAELERDLPGFNDAHYQTLMKSAQAVGYKLEEVATWIDPRAIKLLDKAYKYDQLQAGKPPTTKKVVVPPKVVKPGQAQAETAQQRKEGEAMKRLRGNGTIENAADVIRSRLG